MGIICIFKLEQTVKVIRFSRNICKVIANVIKEIRPGEDCRSLAHVHWRYQALSIDDFLRYLRFVQSTLTPLLIFVTILFVLGFTWAVVVLWLTRMNPYCAKGLMWNGTKCVDAT